MRIRITIEYDLDLEQEPSTPAEIDAAIASEQADWEAGHIAINDVMETDGTVTWMAVGKLGEVA